ncbi:hypothetical protein OKJ48_05220 [Streptomyces kunmingensis]|uniref:Secreted protein n=1 Tax=Streptomyces kunmingensis TaxID=68225 RepID=A0ABU6C4K0_9ACTN|nr:hypothetical protein [Streptomyces kunmingensis]MEB3959651.1 hypothetical protein [Streptomyces kunmingensis]
MPALPVRRLATTALCASLLLAAATPAFAANAADERTGHTFVSADPAPGAAAPADPPNPLQSITSILTPVTGLLTSLLTPPTGKVAEQDVQKHTDAIDAALDKAEKDNAARESTTRPGALSDAATTTREGQSDAMAELQSAIDALVKGAATGDTTAATNQLSLAVNGLVQELLSSAMTPKPAA